MRRLLLSLMPIVALAACTQEPAAKPAAALDVVDAWVRLAAVPGRPAAAYFTLNGGAVADRLVSVTSAGVATIELHEGGMHGGMMTMRPLAGADIPAGATVAFAPERNHAMLFGVDPAVKPGGILPLRFKFASGATIDREAKAVAAGDAAPTVP